jgi:hypothetical protein
VTPPALPVNKTLLQNCLNWFQVDFRECIVSLVETQFPNHPLPVEIRSALELLEKTRQLIDAAPQDQIDIDQFVAGELAAAPEGPPCFKQILLRYRRHVAARTEALQEKTFHLGLLKTLAEDITALDAMVGALSSLPSSV